MPVVRIPDTGRAHDRDRRLPAMTGPETDPARWRSLLPVVLPAVIVGLLSSVALIGSTVIADSIGDVLWERIPATIGTDGRGPVWTVAILTFAGMLTGAIVT